MAGDAGGCHVALLAASHLLHPDLLVPGACGVRLEMPYAAEQPFKVL